MAASVSRCLNPRSKASLFKLLSAPSSAAVLKTSSEALQAQAALVEDFPAQQPLAQQSVTPHIIDFSDHGTAFAAKSTTSLLQSYAVLKSCRSKSLVNNAETLLAASKAVLGQKATEKIVGTTFFSHFCAGECVETIKPTLADLQQKGMMPILQYGAEDDVSKQPAEAEFSPEAERKLDDKARLFLRCIANCDNTQPQRGFVSVKVTALGQPNLLERMSQVLADVGGTLDRGHSSGQLRQVLAGSLSAHELRAFDNLMRRMHELASAAYEKGHMRILVDAEHSYMQPAIDAIAIALQQTYNKHGAVIMNTYQCYLKDTAERIENDMRRASREGWTWGAKTVRGAYMHVERARAAQLGYDSPIQDSIAATHSNYNSCVDFVMERVAKGTAELMVASHNQNSVEQALSNMQRHNIRPHTPGSGIYFGQLLGMADHLSYPLGAHGYNIYKICTYGSVNETIAFLIRRALENNDVLGGCAKETDMIRAELSRRLLSLASSGHRHAVA